MPWWPRISQFLWDSAKLPRQLSQLEDGVHGALDTLASSFTPRLSAVSVTSASYQARVADLVKVYVASAIRLPVATKANAGLIVVVARMTASGAVTVTVPGQLVNGAAVDTLPLAVGAWTFVSTGDGWARSATEATGTWTPNWVGRTTPGTQTYSTNTGKYIRSGNLVFVRVEIVLTSNTGGAGDAVIAMPLTVASGELQGLAMSYMGNITMSLGFDFLTIGLDSGSTRCLVFENQTAGLRNNLSITQVGATGRIAFSGVYETSVP